MKKNNHFGHVFVFSTILCLPFTTHSAETIDEIVVLGDFRERLASDLPASVTILDTEEIEEMAVQHFEELIGAIPNLSWSGDGHRAKYFQIRGVGELEQYQGAPNPSVGFLVDDIDFSGIGGIATLFDMQHVEVLRGPQGTRYGANALAGLIYMRSAEPTADFDGRVELQAGDDGMFAGGIAVGGGLNADDNVTGRLSVHFHESNGFRENTYLERDDTNGRDELSARGRLKWSAGDSWEFNLAGLYVDTDNGYDAFAIDNTQTMLSDKPGKDAQESLGGSLRADYQSDQSGDWMFTSITSFADSDIVFSYDADWGNDDSWAPVLYNYISVSDRERSTLSQEFRLVADNWLVGIYALRLEDDISTFNWGEYYDPGYDWADSLNDLFVSGYDATNVAAFGQLDHALGDTVVLTAGVRLERRTTDYVDSAGLTTKPSDNLWGGEIALRFNHSDAVTSFINLSKGYKANGFNLGLSIPDEYRTFDSETLYNLEAGIKTSLLDRTLSINASIFASRHNDAQVRTSFQLNPGDPTSFGYVTINVEESDALGIEADVRWLPTDSLMLYATLGLLNTEFNDVSALSLANLEGRSKAHAPDYTIAFGGSYEHPGGFFARVDVSARDAFYFDVAHDERSRSYQLVNARVGYRSDSWSATLWARNAFDEDYAVRGFYFGNEPPDFPNALYTRSGDPRQVGVTIEKRF
jgi:outer membrane receptor protein involved in Fe transport